MDRLNPVAEAAWPEKHPGYTLPYVCAFPEEPILGTRGDANSRWGPFRYVVVRKATIDEWVASVQEIFGRRPSKATQHRLRDYYFYEIVVD